LFLILGLHYGPYIQTYYYYFYDNAVEYGPVLIFLKLCIHWLITEEDEIKFTVSPKIRWRYTLLSLND